MAPAAADPRQIVIALDPAQRSDLYLLVGDITEHMIVQLESPVDELGPLEAETDPPKDVEAPKPSSKLPKILSPASRDVEDKPSAKLPEQKSRAQPSNDVERIQSAALRHLSSWKNEFMLKLNEIVKVEDTDKIRAERTKRRDALKQTQPEQQPEKAKDMLSFGDDELDVSEDVQTLQELYKPLPSRLSDLAEADRKEILSCVLLLLLSTGKYSAHSRTLAVYLASALNLPQAFLDGEEMEIAQSLMESSTADKDQKDAMSAEAETAKRQQDNKFSRYWKVGLASVAGAITIGVTGGLAAPLVAGALGGILGGVGLGGVASFLGVFWMNGALVGALFGAYGAKMTGELMDTYAKEVEDFRFIPLQDDNVNDALDKSILKKKKQQEENQTRRLRVTIGINGWLNSEEDITDPWRVLSSNTEVFALRYEMKTLLALGTALKDMVSSVAWKALKLEIIKRTVLATLFAALWPISVIKLASNVDNPFSRARHRSDKAGKILADALINRVQGERPVTLIGYSLGASAIHSCLQSLADREAFGLIDNCVIIGTPAPSTPPHWRTLRAVVSGKIFNVYSENDMVLGFVYRMHSLKLGVAGLQAIEGVSGVQNVDLSHSVSGHMRYPALVGEILRGCGFVGIKAGKTIEKDDVIMMKDEQGGEKLFDFDEDHGGEAEGEGGRQQQVTGSMQDLSIKDKDGKGGAGGVAPEELVRLPPRPDEIDDMEEDTEYVAPPPQPPRPKEKVEIQRKPVLPQRAQPSTSDDEPQGQIQMIDHE